MFEYYQNTLCVQGSWLSEMEIISNNSLKVMSHRGQIKKARSGRGLGGYVLYIYESLPQRFRNEIEHDLGIDPYEQSKVISLSKYLSYDNEAAAFFNNYELEDGRYLSEANEAAMDEYIANACVLNAVKKVLQMVLSANPKINKADLWEKISKSIHNIDKDLHIRYPFDLPENPRALRARYESCILNKANERYKRTGLEGLIHENYCNNYSNKITKEIGEWLIAFYALPNKASIPETLSAYEILRSQTGWPKLSEAGITNFLMKPENERIWLLGRDGKAAYDTRFGHTINRDRETLFPNAHWAIDGTKFDAVHYWDNSAKMAANLNIDVIIDVFSEKIIGWSFSETENHVDHFMALRMAVKNTGKRPYLFTYDGQSGHKKMKSLYGKLVAKGGTHHQHKVGRKSNPIEQVFNRLQQQVIGELWFSDKQSIKSKRSSSQVNTDFIKEFKGALPTREELFKHWVLMVETWNGMKHPHYSKSRNEVFEMKSELTRELDPLDQISMFWIDETKPKRYYAHGMPLTVAGVDYDFEVYDANGDIDVEFRQKYVNTNLIVSYNPEYLNDYVALYELNDKKQKVFVAYAQKKREHAQIPILMGKDAKEQLLKDLNIREFEEKRDWDKYLEIAERTGITREKLVDSQNARIDGENYEFNAKMSAHFTKDEQIETRRKTYDRLTQ